MPGRPELPAARRPARRDLSCGSADVRGTRRHVPARRVPGPADVMPGVRRPAGHRQLLADPLPRHLAAARPGTGRPGPAARRPQEHRGHGVPGEAHDGRGRERWVRAIPPRCNRRRRPASSTPTAMTLGPTAPRTSPRRGRNIAPSWTATTTASPARPTRNRRRRPASSTPTAMTVRAHGATNIPAARPDIAPSWTATTTASPARPTRNRRRRPASSTRTVMTRGPTAPRTSPGGRPDIVPSWTATTTGTACETDTQLAAARAAQQPTGKLAFTGFDLEKQLTVAWTLLHGRQRPRRAHPPPSLKRGALPGLSAPKVRLVGRTFGAERSERGYRRWARRW